MSELKDKFAKAGKEAKERKYYTPKIEEFYVGFEYEAQIMNEEYDGVGWMKLIYPKDPLIGESISKKINMGDLRVKYLDQEDIESFGFVCDDYNIFWSPNKLYSISMDRIDNYVDTTIRKHSDIPNNISFRTIVSAKLKNKSELKKLLQQIGVIEDE